MEDDGNLSLSCNHLHLHSCPAGDDGDIHHGEEIIRALSNLFAVHTEATRDRQGFEEDWSCKRKHFSLASGKRSGLIEALQEEVDKEFGEVGRPRVA